MYIESNILELTKPNSFECTVFKYIKSHSLMLVQVRNSVPKMYVTFESVLFFDGPLNWTGANICIANMKELKKIIKSTGFPSELYQHFKLYIVQASSYNINIIAENLSISEHIPPNFKESSS